MKKKIKDEGKVLVRPPRGPPAWLRLILEWESVVSVCALCAMDTSAEIPDLMNCCSPSEKLQKLEEKAQKAQEAFEKEEKARKEIEAAYAKLLAEKNELSASLEGEKGNIADFHEKTNKLKAQKADVEAQLNVSTILFSKLHGKRWKGKSDISIEIFT